MNSNVAEQMTSNLITVRSEDPLELAYAKMIKHEIRHLPVQDQNQKIVGIISDRDLQRALKSTVSGSGSFKVESCEFSPTHRVVDYMSWPVKYIATETSLRTAAQRMVNEKISALLVTDNDLVVGIITSDDLLKVLSDLLATPKSSPTLTVAEFISNPRLGLLAQTISDMGI